MTTLDVALPSVPTSVVLHTATAPRDSNWMTLKQAVLVCSLPLSDYINYLSLDIDECSGGSGPCDHDCTNFPGTYVCSCDEGYLLASDLTSCEGNRQS